MRSIDRLEQQRRLKQQKKNLPPPDEEMEEEMEFPKFRPLNQSKSAFDENLDKNFGGINTAPSIFEKTAVFSNVRSKERC